MGNYIVYSGAVGWGHEAWRGDFYPEDLPEDWQLSFYNTQFRCVYLPFDLWRKASDEEVAGWLFDTQEAFRFVLGLHGALGGDDMRKAARFGERGMVEGENHVVWIEGEPDLRELSRRIQAAAQNQMPLFLISRDAALSPLRKVGELMQVMGV